MGTRNAFPKAGEPSIGVDLGTNINIINAASKLVFEYCSKYAELKVKCTYHSVTSGVDYS